MDFSGRSFRKQSLEDISKVPRVLFIRDEATKTSQRGLKDFKNQIKQNFKSQKKVKETLKQNWWIIAVPVALIIAHKLSRRI